MDKYEWVRGGVTSGSFDDLPLSGDISSSKLGGLNKSAGSSLEPEFFPGPPCEPSDQPPPQASEGGQPQQPQEQPQEEEKPDIGKVIASLAPGGGD